VRPPETRRQELLDAGLRVFRERGVKRATVDDITAAADVAKGTFYLYFDSKDRLFEALRDRFAIGLLAATEAALEKTPAGDWNARVEAIVATAVDYSAARRDELALVFSGHPPETDGSVASAERRFVTLLVETVRDGTEAGALAVADPEITAALIFHALHGGLLEQAHRGGAPARLERIRIAMLELTRRVVSASLDNVTDRQS
jgi:AcrR family transcriptional regulator